MNELSKYLCLLLRHQPEKAELYIDEHGWASVEQLIIGVNQHSSFRDAQRRI
ncbi:RNA 2'-phosphotransferase [Ruminococcus flavefaciens]|uniref:RNA 2'-phosphotransferase n=1 Tax=Ruminococcus flavefaciens TaxID=1265 RepID=UPI0004B70D3F|nr:RNA 2'-phosphotransferase [Ruminococcus flavefaciens]